MSDNLKAAMERAKHYAQKNLFRDVANKDLDELAQLVLLDRLLILGRNGNIHLSPHARSHMEHIARIAEYGC